MPKNIAVTVQRGVNDDGDRGNMTGEDVESGGVNRGAFSSGTSARSMVNLIAGASPSCGILHYRLDISASGRDLLHLVLQRLSLMKRSKSGDSLYRFSHRRVHGDEPIPTVTLMPC